jgi:FkbM family methyltransferase
MLKDILKRYLQRHGYEIYRRPYLPKGVDPLETLRAMRPDWQPRLILDVGANVGQSMRRFEAFFPLAEIHSFEPVSTTYAELMRAAAGRTRIHPHRLALSTQLGTAEIQLQGNTTLNSLQPGVNGPGAGNAPTELVDVTTLDTFCATQGFTHVDLLKSDTEGHELAVLAGAEQLFRDGAVDSLIVEAGLLPGKSRFTPLPALLDHLVPRGLWLAGIYEQYGWRYRQGADFCNALFVRTALLDQSHG